MSPWPSFRRRRRAVGVVKVSEGWLVAPVSKRTPRGRDPASLAGGPGDRAASEAAMVPLWERLVELQQPIVGGGPALAVGGAAGPPARCVRGARSTAGRPDWSAKRRASITRCGATQEVQVLIEGD